MSNVKLSAHATFCLSQAINQLREAAEFTEGPLKDDINELADEVEFLKLEGVSTVKRYDEQSWRDHDRDKACDFI